MLNPTQIFIKIFLNFFDKFIFINWKHKNMLPITFNNILRYSKKTFISDSSEQINKLQVFLKSANESVLNLQY
jgi:hypothetical protein